MASKQENTRNRVVTFYLKHKLLGLIHTVKHFIAEGISKRTIYNIISTYKKRSNAKRSVESGRHSRVKTKQKVKQLYRLMNHKNSTSISAVARIFNCDRNIIKKWLKKRGIKRYKKKK
jgi:transposase